MEYSTLKPWQEISETGIVYTLGSLYDQFQQMTDPRKRQGKQYSLLTLLTLIFLAKLCGKDNPVFVNPKTDHMNKLHLKNHIEKSTKFITKNRPLSRSTHREHERRCRSSGCGKEGRVFLGASCPSLQNQL